MFIPTALKMVYMKVLTAIIAILIAIQFYYVDVDGATRIVGGSEISIDKCLYQLSLLKSNKHACGAVIINKSWALTSAQCVKGSAAKDISVRSGSSSHSSGGTIHKAKKIALHSSYDAGSKDYDIALVEVETAFDLKKLKAVNLPTQGSLIKPGSQASVTGWGVLTSGGNVFPDKLHQVTVPVVENKICEQANGKKITDRMICAGLTTGGKDICNGDFGGPLVHQDKLIGIASWSKDCGKPGSIGVFASISALRDWIKKTAGV